MPLIMRINAPLGNVASAPSIFIADRPRWAGLVLSCFYTIWKSDFANGFDPRAAARE